MIEESNHNHRSLSEILPKTRKARSSSGLKVGNQPVEPSPFAERGAYIGRKPVKKSRFGRWFFVFLVLAGAGILLANHFSSLTVEVKPKQVEVDIDNQFSASALPTELDLEFGTIKDLKVSASRELASSGTELLETKAQGTVIIYNNYSSANQLLIKSTRLATKDGRVFRLDSAVTVPGQKKEAGKLVPGSVEAKVTADKAGAAGNIGLSDFSIPGFAGTAKATKFYARSKAAFTGGQSEQVAKIAESAKATARAELQAEVKKKLMAQVATELPKGSTLVGDSVIIAYQEELKPAEGATGKAIMTETGSLFGIFFDNAKLSGFLAKKYIDGFGDEPILIRNLAELNFSLTDKAKLNPRELEKVTFSLEGNARFVWLIDNPALKEKLAGQDLDNYQKIFLGFPGIDSAKVLNLRPFWLGSFPSDPERIRVSVVAGLAE